MGAGYLLFNYPEGAAEVTKRGREILLKGVEWATGHTLEKVLKETRNKGLENEEERFHWILGEKVSDGLGYTLVNVDTDSFSYTNNSAPTQDDFNAEIGRLNSLYPELIKWENDGVYEKFIVVKAKNYVMVKDGKVKYKGSSLTDQKKEPRLLKLLEELVNVLLNDNTNKEAKLIETYNQACCEAAFTFDVKHWVTKKTVSEKVLEANRPNEQKILNACNMAIEHKVIDGVQAGDKVYLYQAIDGMIQAKSKGELVFSKKGEPKMIQNEILKFPELYKNDQDTEHYLGRIYATLVIIENIIDIDKFTNYSLKKNRELLK
jgi:hypothetical protein